MQQLSIQIFPVEVEPQVLALQKVLASNSVRIVDLLKPEKLSHRVRWPTFPQQFPLSDWTYHSGLPLRRWATDTIRGFSGRNMYCVAFVHVIFLDSLVFHDLDDCLLVLLLRILEAARECPSIIEERSKAARTLVLYEVLYLLE